ncbi:phospholipid-transporting ATPase 1-like [Musa acuminata AAA Group]|uniref:phospholipid-transporting ATPase 1-like n=1 Tax=Musa acuminata AAA Group TaxID=214697 RepID=UPI0031E235D9
MLSSSSSPTKLSLPLLPSMASAAGDPQDARLVFVGDPDRSSSPGADVAASNAIRTTKYSLLTFIPRNLFEQFRRVAYIYFLALALLNQIPQLTVFGRQTAFLPLGTVLLLTAIKDAYEDYQRHRSDTAENNRPASVLPLRSQQAASTVRKKWKEIRVGELVRVVANETIPCDMVLLATSDPTGVAYVQTINLDGESNLKSCYAKLETASLAPEALAGAIIRCEPPNLNIYRFQATIELRGDGPRIPLGPTNIVLRGCDIKNTSWVVGVAVYIGTETKVMLNNSGAPSKRSRLETRMNREIIVLAVIMVGICSLIAISTVIWLHSNRDKLDTLPFYRRKDYSRVPPRDYLYNGLGLEMLFAFLKSIFRFQNFIPISLYISMELSRLMQSFMMTQDESMCHEATGNKLKCRALNINEDLGQIKYVFSDKTGTLTENKMVFQCASIHGIDYVCREPLTPGEIAPHPTIVDGQVWRPKVMVNTDRKLLRLLETERDTEAGLYAVSFFLALATCNTIVPQVLDTSDPAVKLIDYQGDSPDEQALVYAAAAYGFVLIERTSGHITIDVLGERQRFEVLGLHAFDSDRKRMSAVICCPDNSVKLFVKGADSAMFSILDRSFDLEIVRATEMHLHAYSSLGLRTLVIGMRDLSGREFENWKACYNIASTSLSGREDLLGDIASQVESDLRILGATGIEDKLQQGVPEAIESLRKAGMRVWVLTGDKRETAISIGYSCKLISNNMSQIIINSHSKESCKQSLEDAITMCEKLTISRTQTDGGSTGSATVPVALIIDGPTLVHILETELEDGLYRVATTCDVVLCCRVAPLQKAGIVALIKKRTNDMTLSIGDGANDVSMIQMADVGIGISGQEGRQAVMASDFAIGQFRFLVPLLLVHGHWNYQRIGYMIIYNFYRNSVVVFLIFWYTFFSAFSLISPITDASGFLYSAVYTALPTVIVGIYDQDLSHGTLLSYPQLYGPGLRDERYNRKLFVLIMLDSVWQSLVTAFVPFLFYSGTLDDSSLGDIWIVSVVLLVNIHLAMDVFSWNWILLVTLWGVTAIAMGCIVAIDASPSMPGYWAINNLMATKLFWLCLLCILVLALLPRFVVKVFASYVKPDDVQIVREIEKVAKRKHDGALEALLRSSSDHQQPNS